eukprot:c15684_g1_i1 orf=41-973(+)
MKASLFEEVSGFLESSDGAGVSMEGARARFPQVSLDTLLAIQCQLQTRRVRLTHYKHRHPHLIQQYISRYVNGEDILCISNSYEINPCLLARILLEHLFGLTKQQITECLKDPGRLPKDKVNEVSQSLHYPYPNESDKTLLAGEISVNLHGCLPCVSWGRLHDDLYKCMDHDNATSPYIELIRRVTGIEYEAHLCRQLQELGIPFQTENDLRAAGFSKTPDVKLEVPIAVKGRIVNWIDSKASFGDECSHKNQAELQFQRYVNRFGPGMVIYWFGFVDELNNHPDVLLLDSFPSKQDIYCLPSLTVYPRQ